MRMSWWAELCCKSLCSVWGRSHMYWVHGSLPWRLFVDIGTAVFTFDLFYICSGHQNWLNLDKRVLEHDFARRAGSLVLIFAVRWEIVLIVYFFTWYEICKQPLLLTSECFKFFRIWAPVSFVDRVTFVRGGIYWWFTFDWFHWFSGFTLRV